MTESREQPLEISHYIENGKFIGFVGYEDDESVKINTSLYGKKIGNYGEVTSFNSALADAIKEGLIDEKGNLTDKGLVLEEKEVAKPQGHKKERPKVDRSTAGKKTKAKTRIDDARQKWLEELGGHHAIIEMDDRDIKLLASDLFFKDMIGEEELESLIERDLIEKNDNNKYVLTEKGRRMAHGIKAIRNLERSMNLKKRDELVAKESTEGQIEKALKNIEEIDSYNITKSNRNWYDVTLTLKSGEELSCRIKDKTNFTEIKSQFIRVLKEYIKKFS